MNEIDDDGDDPIVAEVRRHRREHAAKFNYDIGAIFDDIEERERTSGRVYVRLNPDGTKTYVRYGKVIDPSELPKTDSK